MPDLETRLRETLSERAAEAPDAIGLAAGARQRLRRRRTTWAAAVAAAVVAAAIPVGLGLGQVRGGSDPTPDDTAPVASEAPPVTDGFRAETWRDLTLEVPEDWGHGGSDWCANGGTLGDEPRVGRPDTVVFSILCSPGNGYGATIASSATFDPAYASGEVWRYDTEGVVNAQYPDDTWLSYWYDGSDVVTVATPDRALTQRIVDSVTRFEGLDPYGCPPTLGEAEALTSAERPLTLCRYSAEDLLSASGSWTGDAAASRWATLAEAPLADPRSACADQAFTSRIAILDADGYRATAVADGCREGLGIYFSGVVRQVTEAARQVLTSIG
ncbi:hypothetical protein [Nocardioides zhouii]|uniref:Uncharacterized protein n=1 Tax=Nocardioides zhouii TaxID=1168729 RepID=A0A4Q2T5Z8_9ACTN|nr:hypothetical protein [Nocardioides zhouii]RYC12540.1 hypothetical protein EUA94_07675 [Nocardioides zhouii]